MILVYQLRHLELQVTYKLLKLVPAKTSKWVTRPWFLPSDSALGSPLGKQEPAFSRTQGFHQPAEIKICISVSSHVQTAAGDDVSALDCCTASPVCPGGGWVRAARYQSSDLGGKVPPKVVFVLPLPTKPCPRSSLL